MTESTRICIREYSDDDRVDTEHVFRVGLKKQEADLDDVGYAENTLGSLIQRRRLRLSNWWVGTDEGGAIVAAMAVQLSYGSDVQLGAYALIQELDVLPTHRGTGIGKQMIGWAEQEAREAGEDALLSATHPENTDSRDFHEKCGFERYEPFDRRDANLIAFVKKLTQRCTPC